MVDCRLTGASGPRVPICDLDGTLLDSDRALADAFVALGVDRSRITFGHVLVDECARLGLSVDDYLDVYDPSAAHPFDGVPALIDALPTWAVCSNKHPRSGTAELARLGWDPAVAMFADTFEGPKRLGPVLDALRLTPDEVVFVGDTDHDRRCTTSAGVPFVLAVWNPRAETAPGDIVLRTPGELLDLLGL